MDEERKPILSPSLPSLTPHQMGRSPLSPARVPISSTPAPPSQLRRRTSSGRPSDSYTPTHGYETRLAARHRRLPFNVVAKAAGIFQRFRPFSPPATEDTTETQTFAPPPPIFEMPPSQPQSPRSARGLGERLPPPFETNETPPLVTGMQDIAGGHPALGAPGPCVTPMGPFTSVPAPEPMDDDFPTPRAQLPPQTSRITSMRMACMRHPKLTGVLVALLVLLWAGVMVALKPEGLQKVVTGWRAFGRSEERAGSMTGLVTNQTALADISRALSELQQLGKRIESIAQSQAKLAQDIGSLQKTTSATQAGTESRLDTQTQHVNQLQETLTSQGDQIGKMQTTLSTLNTTLHTTTHTLNDTHTQAHTQLSHTLTQVNQSLLAHTSKMESSFESHLESVKSDLTTWKNEQGNRLDAHTTQLSNLEQGTTQCRVATQCGKAPLSEILTQTQRNQLSKEARQGFEGLPKQVEKLTQEQSTQKTLLTSLQKQLTHKPTPTPTPTQIPTLTSDQITQLVEQAISQSEAKLTQKMDAEMMKKLPKERSLEEIDRIVQKALAEHLAQIPKPPTQPQQQPQPTPPPTCTLPTTKLEQQAVLDQVWGDIVQRPDLALYSAGGRVIKVEKPYGNLFYRFLSFIRRSPNLMLVPSRDAGNCFPLNGTHGNVTIKLSHPARVSAVTIDHVWKKTATDPSTAPRQFKAYCQAKDVPEQFLTQGSYSVDHASPAQIFPLEPEAVPPEPCQAVRFEILNNHGNTNYTCIYRLRVHPLQEPEIQ